MIKKHGAAALKGKEVDHKVPLAAGGSTGMSNLTILSRKANRKKQPKRK
ncbi:HNH endonuclease [Aminobacter anthyllidis]|uniref:HNH endonuclease n=1 Tax=Aminobacter anthyllidis TaxID=1035067 RepID=A0A9X1D407_9HYPH|nr:HNH endonuclease signature motif containing protein [Aminobacter anthyllidis]MBT1154426.1 HNH endonuclease [Aminobacter anthyllidis]